ncbi:MAG: glycine zipper 2TM domain-containing protein [Verrucomicrobiota bacterium]
MTKKSVLIVLPFFTAVLWLTGCATVDQQVSPVFQQQQPDRIAVVDVTGDIKGDANKNQIEDFFVKELMKKGYRVIERSRVNKLLEEQEFQRSDSTSTNEAAQIGEVINVPAVAMIDVNVDGEKISITGRMLDVETGEILWIASSRGGSGQTLSTIAGAVVGGAAGSQVGSGRGRTAATIAGGVLGGAAGRTMAPQTARVIEKAIQRMMEELPPAR